MCSGALSFGVRVYNEDSCVLSERVTLRLGPARHLVVGLMAIAPRFDFASDVRGFACRWIYVRKYDFDGEKALVYAGQANRDNKEKSEVARMLSA